MRYVPYNRFAVLLFLLPFSSLAHAQDPDSQQTESAFPALYNSETDLADWTSPQEALARIRLPSGFRATLFSAEPEVQNPIAASFDARGRLWVAENYSYAERAIRFDLKLNDRVVVLEDIDGDGVADKRTVFIDTLKMLTGIVVGQGGVWVTCPPQLLFIPDADGDLVPDGPAEVKLDGFHVARENYHGFVNGLSWGPDSWLYGRCGASNPGEMGLPGTPDDERVPVRGGIWRYHPQRKVVEALVQGTTNPWGHDWNSIGELFFINTVNGHLWHAFPGAHFDRSHTLDSNPHIYKMLGMHADHWHFDTGQSWTASRDGAANDYGGGHAHVGMMIYHGDAWPKRYRDKLMTVNMHGRRINTEKLDRQGSGYVGRHDADFLLSDDIWFRGTDIIAAPDGNALVIDWSDTGECHESTGVHRESGRIFKVVYGTNSPASSRLDAEKMKDDLDSLATLQQTGSEWESRRARELMRSAKLRGVDTTKAVEVLDALLASDAPIELRLRALWSLIALDAVSQKRAFDLLEDSSGGMRAWAIRVLTDKWAIDNTTDGARPAAIGELPDPNVGARLVRLARDEPSAAVRLVLASTLQRLPYKQRPALAKALFSHADDANDHNLPLLVWYGLTPLGESHLSALVDLASVCRWPVTLKLIARRVADQIDSRPEQVDRLVEVACGFDQAFQSQIVLGIGAALAGRRKVGPPAHWSKLSALLAKVKNEDVKRGVSDLNVLFGDGRAIDELKRVAQDEDAPTDVRLAALQSLAGARADGIREICMKLLRHRYLNLTAAQGLATETDPLVGVEMVKAYRRFDPLHRPSLISIVVSRSGWAKSLLAAVEEGRIDRTEISPFQARQIASFGDPELDALLAKTWGQVRESPAERLKMVARLKVNLTPENLAAANLKSGRVLFDKNCSSCHKLFGQGGQLGPDLTGAQRSNLDFLLENIVDPSAVVTKEFRATVVLLDDGRVLTGLVTSKTENIVTMATQNETFRIVSDEIESIKQSSASTMPDGLLSQLTEDQVRDLFGYLQARQQVSGE